ncbi:hypothetical protein Tco_0693489, partial [Tanacetum coccineum]
LVLRVEKKPFVIEQPLPAAPAANSEARVLAQWNTVYDAYNEVACLILGSMTPELHIQFENSSPYDMIKELKSMFEKQARVEHVGLILNGLTSNFAGFVRNYNMHNMRKTIGGRIQKANKKSLNAKGKDKGKGKRKDKPVYIPGMYRISRNGQNKGKTDKSKHGNEKRTKNQSRRMTSRVYQLAIQWPLIERQGRGKKSRAVIDSKHKMGK